MESSKHVLHEAWPMKKQSKEFQIMAIHSTQLVPCPLFSLVLLLLFFLLQPSAAALRTPPLIQSVLFFDKEILLLLQLSNSRQQHPPQTLFHAPPTATMTSCFKIKVLGISFPLYHCMILINVRTCNQNLYVIMID